MKPWIRRGARSLAALAALTAVTGAVYETVARRDALRDFPAPGRLVDVGGGRRIQIDCRGAGVPTVVLEAGLDAFGALSWVPVHDSLAATTRTCAYSRAGIMWSDAADGPFDSERSAEDLHTALAGAGEQGPLVLVGHSLGAPYALTFARRFPAEVAGLVFVDGSHPDQMRRFALAGVAPTGERAVLWVASRLGPVLLRLGAARLIPELGAAHGWSSREQAAYRALASRSLTAMLREGRALERSLANARAAEGLGARPLTVLTAMRVADADTTAPAARRHRDVWRAMHAEEARWSTRGRHVLVHDATHYIHEDRPDIVIAEVRQVVRGVRAPVPDGAGGPR